ncbi:hypothetical protein BJX61DRAFT_543683 [Aspergillus egyptiacus]|nr:hypothetical protein BJX61DRAFT_543683 [Aspergillus egyptiacus]
MHPNPPPLTLQLDPTCSDPHKPFGTYTRHAAFQVCNRYLESNSSDTLSAHQATRLLYQMIPETKPHNCDRFNNPVDSGGYAIYESMSETLPDAARLASAGLGSNREGMVWCMKNALEMPPREFELQDSSAVCQAALWILFAGQHFFDEVVVNPEVVDCRQDSRRMYQPGRLYEGPIFGLERWRFWMRRLAEASGDCCLTEEARALAGNATGLMAAIADGASI